MYRACICAAVLLLAAAAVAEESRPVVQITPGRARAFRAAVQRFSDLATPVNPQRAEDLRVAVGEGLRFSGVLLPLELEAFLGSEDTKLLERGRRYDCGDWTQSGADALVEGEITADGDVLAVEFAVWDTARCIRLVREQLRRPRSEAQLLARAVADQVVAAFTGVRGVADTEVAFVSNRTGHREVFVMDAYGGNARAATRSRAIKSLPGWFPTGEAILYTSYTHSGQPGLFLSSRGGAPPGPLLAKVLPGAPKYRGVFDPTGARLAIVASIDSISEIFSVRRDGRKLRRLTRNSAIDVAPSWSPDGKQLAFVSDRSGGPQIYVMDLEAKATRRLTFQGSYNTAPSWSPDGRWIAYQSRLVGQFDIWLIDPTGETNVPLVDHPRTDESPSWSPDGRKLVFSSTRRGRSDLYVMDLNGEDLRRLTRESGDNFTPSWGPFSQ